MTALRRFARLSSAEWALLVEAGLLVLAARIALWLLPWHRVLGLLRSLRIPRPAGFGVDRLVWAVRNASRLVPQATCLTQALALHRLVSSAGYPSRIQIGVAKGPNGAFEAHAWVEHDCEPLLNSTGEVGRYSRLLTVEEPSR